MLIHPQFNPIALALGPVKVHWYGLMYLAAFMLFLFLGRYRIRTQPQLGWNTKDLDDLLFYGMMGVILGGRLGYILFYKPAFYFANPLDIFKLWEGGMAFHGGFLGVLVALWLFGRKTGRHFLQVGDFVAPLVPTGLAAGRMGNFINGELWGRVTSSDFPLAMLFPQAKHADEMLAISSPSLMHAFSEFGALPRHPSQLYQFALEGLTLFAILWLFTRKPKPMGAASGMFLLGYGSLRFLAEFAREPDAFLGLLRFNMSMGQWLSLPMILLGLAMIIWSFRRARREGGMSTA